MEDLKIMGALSAHTVLMASELVNPDIPVVYRAGDVMMNGMRV